MTKIEFELLKLCAYQSSAISELRRMVSHLYEHLAEGKTLAPAEFTDAMRCYADEQEKVTESLNILLEVAMKDTKNA